MEFNRPVAAAIDLSALRRNFETLRSLAGPGVKILAVVKAGSYGHGAIPVARELVNAGADLLGLALVQEAIELRMEAIRAPMVILGGVHEDQVPEVVEFDLRPVVFRTEICRALSKQALKWNRPVGVHLKIDTGMGRLGVRPEGLAAFLEEFKTLGGLRLDGVMTHLCESEAEDPAFTREQLALFEESCREVQAAGLPVERRHAANTAAIMQHPGSVYEMVRPGLGLYGCWPAPALRERLGARIGLEPVMTWKTKIALVKEVPAGTPLSYGRTYVTLGPARIATLPVGYADGYRRCLSGVGQVLIGGRRCPVVGAVTMDMILADVTDAPEAELGAEAVLLGRQGDEEIGAWEMAEWIGTIPYEVFCGVSERVSRVYGESMKDEG